LGEYSACPGAMPIPRSQRVATEISAMGRPRKRLQTDQYDGRMFTTIPVTIGGRVSYHRIHLRTKDADVARRRLTALDGVDDPDEARRRIDHLASAGSESLERARLADFLQSPMFRQRVTIEDAREELAARFNDFEDMEEPSEELLERWRHASCPAEWQPILIELGADTSFLFDSTLYEGLKLRGREADPEWWRKNPDKHHEVLAAEWGMSPAEWLDRGASAEKLLDCLPHFETEKRNKGTSTRHRRTCAKVFRRFVECVGNKSINRLAKQDFISWEDEVKQEKGKRSTKWVNDQLTPIAAIIKIAHRRMRDDLFPEGWRAWIEFGKAAYRPGSQNREPMPVAIFKACLEQAHAWASIDIEAYADALPLRGANAVMARANNFRQATRRRRAGYMMEVVLRLCCNVGADPVDLERLTWRYLRLHGSLPLFMLPRYKAAKQLGAALPRNTPLLPSTVEAFRRWKAWRRREAADSNLRSDRHGHEYADFVFTNDKRRPYKSEKISHAFARLAKAVGKKASNWRLKHLRNVGATLGKRHKRLADERTTFLAHSEGGTNRFYEGDVGEDYLVALVNLIGEEYFDGEQVAVAMLSRS